VTSFIPLMLCERLTNVSRLADRAYTAEPKLDHAAQKVRVYAVDEGQYFSRHRPRIVDGGWRSYIPSSFCAARPPMPGSNSVNPGNAAASACTSARKLS
jgi:hypothetical protein